MDVTSVDAWSTELGLLPVPAFANEEKATLYVLLNGTKGNFCLDVHTERPRALRRNLAWSANVGHYVALDRGDVEVQSWAQRSEVVERYSLESIRSKIESFYEYLENNSPPATLSVVAHGIRVFRSLRGVLGSEIRGEDALEAFLFLLACVKDNTDRDDLDFTRWELTEQAKEIVSLVSRSEWEAIQADLRGGRRVDKLSLDMDLLLRHASGVLFQEAHHEAVSFNPQKTLGFFPPDPVSIAKIKFGVGVHFTPPPLSRALVEHSLSFFDVSKTRSLTIFDPACGSGEFLREALRQLNLKGYSGRLKLIGWDLSAAACAVARFALAAEIAGRAERTVFDVSRRDSLDPAEDWPASLDVILMNPPFVSWQGMDAEQRMRLAALLGTRIERRPDMSAGFVYRAAEALQPRGVIGSILPASFFDTASHRGLRGYLQTKLSSVLVGRLGSHMLFPGATVDAGFYVARAVESGEAAPIALWSDYRPSSTSAALRSLRKISYGVRRDFDPIVFEGYSIYRNPELVLKTESWAPRPFTPWKLSKELQRSNPTVRSLFHVRQGSRTGFNKIFLLTRSQLELLPEGERSFFRPAVLNESIRAGKLLDTAFVFYPYGKKIIATESELRRLLPRFFNTVLKPRQTDLEKRARIRRSGWWQLMESRTWQHWPEPKLVSTYFGDRGSFAWDSDGAYVAVQAYAWLPKKEVSPIFQSQKMAYAYLSILNSRLFSKLLSANANNVGGGQWDLSTRFVGQIPLPNLAIAGRDPSLIDALARIGQLIFRDGLDSLSQSDLDMQEDSVGSAYGVTSYV